MKRKIVIGLSVFSSIFILSGIYATVSIELATSKLDMLVRLHQVELMREHLLIEIKQSQADLYLRNTKYATDIATIVAHVRSMDDIIHTCFTCHHTEAVARKLRTLEDRIERYKSALSRVFTFRANAERRGAEEENALKLGMDLLAEVNGITAMTSKRLDERTRVALVEIARTKKGLYAILAFVPLLAVLLSVVFIRGVTRPLGELRAATGQLKDGNLNYRIGALPDEFGEVAESFNAMAASLKEHCRRMQWAEQLVILGEMAGGFAHEIKNPLAGIKASTEVLSNDQSVSAENRAVLHKVTDQIRKIEVILKGLLNFAKPPKPQFAAVSVNTVVEATVGLVEQHPAFSARQWGRIELMTDLDPRLPVITADPLQLQQVLFNLLINAADAMQEDGTIAIKTGASEREPFVRIELSDTGQGIEEAELGKIFQPFFTTKAHGTGLGLSIAKGLIEQHGGYIGVVNKPGRGVCFTIDLPVRQGLGVEELRRDGI